MGASGAALVIITATIALICWVPESCMHMCVGKMPKARRLPLLQPAMLLYFHYILSIWKHYFCY